MRLLLLVLLLVVHPASFALTAGSALGSLSVRGLPMVVLLLARLIATGAGIAAGIAISNRRPGAPTLAQAALALSLAASLAIYLTPFFPNNRAPGDTPFYVAGSLVYHVGWILYLRLARGVRNWEESV